MPPQAHRNLHHIDGRDQLISTEPDAERFIRPFIGAEEYINGDFRYCLWLLDVPPHEFRKIKYILGRIEKVKQFRLSSARKETLSLAKTPSLFGEIRQPDSDYLIIPKVSSESRRYIPIGYCPSHYIANGSSLIIPNASLYDFGIISSEMHMSWMRHVGGRTKSDYQYSNGIIYNNFPWPEKHIKHKKMIENKAQAVLDARNKFPNSTLADLYDPNAMPSSLVKAHHELNLAVDKAYRKDQFNSDNERIEFLFEIYQKLTAPVIVKKILAKERKGK